MSRSRKSARGNRGPLEREARTTLRESSRVLARIERTRAASIAAAAEAVVAALGSGGTVFFCGNGGSAADAQHMACELAGRYLLERPGLAAVALTTNTSSLTAIGNDYGFEQVFARQLEGLATPGDVLVAFTTSGRSPNMRAAVDAAHAIGMVVIGFTGEPGRRFAASCDYALVTPSTVTPRIQEGHLVMAHAVFELVERALYAPQRRTRASSRATRRATRRPASTARRTRGRRT